MMGFVPHDWATLVSSATTARMCQTAYFCYHGWKHPTDWWSLVLLHHCLIHLQEDRRMMRPVVVLDLSVPVVVVPVVVPVVDYCLFSS